MVLHVFAKASCLGKDAVCWARACARTIGIADKLQTNSMEVSQKSTLSELSEENTSNNRHKKTLSKSIEGAWGSDIETTQKRQRKYFILSFVIVFHMVMPPPPYSQLQPPKYALEYNSINKL